VRFILNSNCQNPIIKSSNCKHVLFCNDAPKDLYRGHEPAVNAQDGAGNVRGRVTCQENGDVSVLLWPAVALQRDGGSAFLLHVFNLAVLAQCLLLVKVSNARRGDTARDQYIGCNPEGADLASQGLRPASQGKTQGI